MKENPKTRVALVGGGFVAGFHLGPLQGLPWVEVAALVDPDKDRAERLQARWDIPSVHEDLGSLLEAELPDVAHVLVPPPLHAGITKRLLDASVHVFVEKPLALTSHEAGDLESLAEEKGLALGVNHSQVFHPGFRELRRRLGEGHIGPPVHVVSITSLPLRQLSERQYGHWMFQDPANILFESGPHPFSLIHALLGEVRSARTTISKARLLGDALPFHKSWQTLLRCEKGSASAYLDFGSSYPESRLTVIGPDGSLELDLFHGFLTEGGKTRWPEFFDTWLQGRRRAKALRKRGGSAFMDNLLSLLRLRDRSDLFYLSMKHSIEAFHEALHEGRRPPASGKEGREVLAFCEAVWKGREPEFYPSPAPQIYDPPQGDRREALVLGGSGFIGSHLVEALSASGYKVRALVRQAGNLPAWLNHPSVMVLEGRLQDRETLEQALSGVHSVFHLATGLGEDWEETLRTGIEGTKRLAESCLDQGIRRLCFTSSLAALYLGGGNPEQRIDESLGLDPHPRGRSLYARLKIACEEILMNLHLTRGLPVVIFRPGLVVGARGRTRHGGVGFWARDNHCLGWGAGLHPLPFVLVKDVVSALLLGEEKEEAEGEVFHLAGPVRLTAREYLKELSRLTGRELHFHPRFLPWVQVQDIGKWIVKALVRRPGNRFPSWRDLRTRSLEPWLDCRKAEEVLGWQPERDRVRFVDKGIRAPLEEEI